MGAILIPAIASYFIFKVYLCFVGVDHYWGSVAAFFVVLLSIILRFIPAIMIGSFFGAIDVMGWPWWIAILISFPGILMIFAVPAMVAFSNINFPSAFFDRMRQSNFLEKNKIAIISIPIVALIAMMLIFDGDSESANRSSSPQTLRYSSGPAPNPQRGTPAANVAPSPSPPARLNPTLEGFTVRTEQFGDWNFQERRDPAGNRICLIQSTSTSTPATPLLGVGWSGRSRSTNLFMNSDAPPITILNVSVDNQNFNLYHNSTITLASNLRTHHYFFPEVMIGAFSGGNVMMANGVRYSLRGSSRAYGALAACINAGP